MALASLHWDARFVHQLPGDTDRSSRRRQVRKAVWAHAAPTQVAAPRVLAWSAEVADMLGLTEDEITSQAFADAFGGNTLLPGMTPRATCYGGHQFGNWAGQLGDGRAMTLGEVQTPAGHLELQLKGAGPTPFSRGGDGRAVLRSSIREFLCSEAMHHLGIPTTRALCLIGTGDDVLRDMFYDGHAAMEPGAIVCRVAPSFLRPGHFQIHARRGDTETLRTLVAYTLRHHFPEIWAAEQEATPAACVRLLDEVVRRHATLVAHWMRVGFVHGVLNTDNLSILGLTVDYGPYGWLEPWDLDWTPNTTDAGMGRYRFGWQPDVVGWNLTRFAEALLPIVGEAAPLEAVLESYETRWLAAHGQMVAGKLGLRGFEASDKDLWDDLSGALSAFEVDMTIFFRHLSGVPLGEGTEVDRIAAVAEAFYAEPFPTERERLAAWLDRYAARVRSDAMETADRAALMHRHNPKYVLRNYLAQEAIDLATVGDLSRVHTLLEVMRRPYDEQPEHAIFAAKRPEWARHRAGCSQLSCSS